MSAPYDSRRIASAAGARLCGGALKFSGLFINFYGLLGREAQKKSSGYFSFTQSSRFAFHLTFNSNNIRNNPFFESFYPFRALAMERLKFQLGLRAFMWAKDRIFARDLFSRPPKGKLLQTRNKELPALLECQHPAEARKQSKRGCFW